MGWGVRAGGRRAEYGVTGRENKAIEPQTGTVAWGENQGALSAGKVEGVYAQGLALHGGLRAVRAIGRKRNRGAGGPSQLDTLIAERVGRNRWGVKLSKWSRRAGRRGEAADGEGGRGDAQDYSSATENEISLLQIRADDAENRRAEDHEQIQIIQPR
ncbi:hypothetical protein Tco_1153893 [Tanacetum coccineum]